MPIVNRIADLHGEIIAWRRDIHARPRALSTAGLSHYRTPELQQPSCLSTACADRLRAWGERTKEP